MSHGLGEAPDPLDGEPGASATGESTRPRKCEELPRSVGIWIETDTKFSLVVHEAVSGRLDNLRRISSTRSADQAALPVASAARRGSTGPRKGRRSAPREASMRREKRPEAAAVRPFR